jgi:glutamyl-Q tRNA(Asp) synthetase
MEYIGRFAPSPSGPLHLGSLVAAVASYLHARSAGGQWLVRIEDIDPPRQVPLASEQILATLAAFELHSDEDVFFQSRHIDDYLQASTRLLAAGQAYRCSCSRREIRDESRAGPIGHRYPGTCRTRTIHERPTAVRVRSDQGLGSFQDELQGTCRYDVEATIGDYVIFRNDGLPAYHLAVVLDDARQGITHVARGVDLLQTTGQHIHLQQTLGLPTPQYFHFPVVVNSAKQKLSKRTGARAVLPQDAIKLAPEILRYLGLEPPRSLCGQNPRQLWAWASETWDPRALRGQTELLERPSDG